MTKIAGILLALAPYFSIAAPGSYSGNVDGGGVGGSVGGWELLLAFVGLPLTLVIISLICDQPAPAGKKTWWTSMDATGKGVTIILGIILFIAISSLLS